MPVTLLEDLRHAARQVRRSPRLTLTVVLTLAIAIGGASSLVSVLNAIAWRQLPVPRPDRLALISLTDRRGQTARLIPYTTFQAFAAQQQVFDGLCFYSGGGVFPLEGRGTLVDGNIAVISPSCVTVLGLQPALGRLLVPEDAPGSGDPARVVVLGYEMWQRLFHGDPRAIGEPLSIDGAPITIVGVMSRDFPGVHVDAGNDFYIPTGLTQRLHAADRNRPIRAYNIIGRLRDGITLDQARAAIATAWPALQAATLPTGLSPAQQEDVQAQQLHVESADVGISSLRRRYSNPLSLLAGLAAALLLIGCANLSGLLLSRAIARQRQLAVCLALGATRFRLARVSMMESLLLSISASLAAIPFTWAASRASGAMLWSSDNVPLALSMTPDLRVIGAMGAVAIASGLVVGAVPAWAVSRSDPLHAVQHQRTMAPARTWWTRGLLVAQIALSLVLLVGAGLFMGSLRTLRTLDSGFSSNGLLFARAWHLPGPLRIYDEQTYYPALVERLSAQPGVRAVALSQGFPAYFNVNFLVPQPVTRDEGDGQRSEAEALLDHISPRFFATIGSTILRGRDFTWTDRAGQVPVAIINETLERKLFPAGGAIGHRLRLGSEAAGQPYEIVGISRDVTVGNLRAAHQPVLFRPQLQHAAYMRQPIVLVRGTGDAAAASAALASEVRAGGQEYVRNVIKMDEHVDRSLQQERLLASVSSWFAALAALLSFVGVYGLLAQAVARRTREIGVRMAIGASRSRVVALVVGEAATVTAGGVVVGIPCAIWASRLADTLLYGQAPTDARVLTMAAVSFVIIGVMAAWLPAHRASKVDPMIALRCD